MLRTSVSEKLTWTRKSLLLVKGSPLSGSRGGCRGLVHVLCEDGQRVIVQLKRQKALRRPCSSLLVVKGGLEEKGGGTLQGA